jgi:hypothetical protein
MKFDYKVKLNGVYYPANTEINLNATVEAVKPTAEAVKPVDAPDNKPKSTSKKTSKK